MSKKNTRTSSQDSKSPIVISVAKYGLVGTLITALFGLAGVGLTAYLNNPVVVIPIKTLSVTFLTSHSRYVTAMDNQAGWNWQLRAETKNLGEWEKFLLSCVDDSQVAFIDYHRRYVTAMDDQAGQKWELRAETKNLGEWEKFTLVETKTGRELLCSAVFKLLQQGSVAVAIKTYHGRYVTAMDDQAGQKWELRAETKNLGEWEKFMMIPLAP